MRDIHLHIDEVVVDGVELADPRAFRGALEAALAGLAERHRGEFPAGTATVLHGPAVTAATPDGLGAEVARSIWSSIIPARNGGG